MVSFGFVIPGYGPLAQPSAVDELLAAGEALGYDSVWYGDHVVVPSYAAAFTHPDWLEPIAAICYGLGKTKRLRFGTDVLVAPYRNPVLVAKMLATADHLSGGRVTLGVGVGYLKGEFAIVGADYRSRGAATDEFLDVVRALWNAEGAVAFDGRFTRFHDAVFGPPTVQRPLPVWVGGNAPHALRRAAMKGDGWHPLFPSPEAYAAGRGAIEAMRGSSAPFAFSYSCAVTTLVDREPTDFATGTWDEHHDIPDDFSYAPAIPTAPNGRPRFVGTPDQVAADVREYVDVGVEHFTLRFAHGGSDVELTGMLAQMQGFAVEVAPRFSR